MDLPIDIQELILSNIHDIQDIFNIRLCCKLLCSLITLATETIIIHKFCSSNILSLFPNLHGIRNGEIIVKYQDVECFKKMIGTRYFTCIRIRIDDRCLMGISSLEPYHPGIVSQEIRGTLIPKSEYNDLIFPVLVSLFETINAYIIRIRAGNASRDQISVKGSDLYRFMIPGKIHTINFNNPAWSRIENYNYSLSNIRLRVKMAHELPNLKILTIGNDMLNTTYMHALIKLIKTIGKPLTVNMDDRSGKDYDISSKLIDTATIMKGVSNIHYLNIATTYDYVSKAIRCFPNLKGIRILECNEFITEFLAVNGIMVIK